MTTLCLAALSLVVGLVISDGPADPNYIVNGGFENGLGGWLTEGDVHVETHAPLAGTSSASIGPGKGAISQRYSVGGLQIMEFGATVRLSAANVAAIVRVRCMDGRGRVLMDLRQAFDPKKGLEPKGASTGIYFKTHAMTKSVIVSIEKISGAPGAIVADTVELHDYDHDRKTHAPACDLTHYMTPVWNGGIVYDESVLMLSSKGEHPAGKLLFRPTGILSVKDSTLATEYKEGKDFEVEGQTLVALPGSSMVSVKDTDFPKGDYPWLSVAGKHVFVTYKHEDAWKGPLPGYQAAKLPITVGKLKQRKPLTIVALGDSITLGINVSGYRGDPPYTPTWPELVAHQLQQHFRYDRINMFNTALGGMTSQWGKDNARDAVASLNPDLVLIAFGMNDFWSISPEEFRANIEATIRTVRSRMPKAEFILVSSIRFDPAYTTDPTYVGHMTGYEKELKALCGPGICLLDLTALSDYLYEVKNPKDLLADPMHPDDFLARLFAQSVVGMLGG